MKHKDTGNIDLGLENIIKGEGVPIVQSSTSMPPTSEADESLEKLYSDGNFKEILKRVEPLYETSPVHKLWWIRVQKKIKAVPEIFLLPLFEEVKALNDPSHSVLISAIENEFSMFCCEPLKNQEDKAPFSESSSLERSHFGHVISDNASRSIFSRVLIFALIISLALGCFFYFTSLKDGELSALPEVASVAQVIDPGIKRVNVGSFSSLLYDFEEKVQNVETPVTVASVPEIQTPSPKVTINTDTPKAPDEQLDEKTRVNENSREKSEEKQSAGADIEATYEVVSNTYVYSRPTLSAPPITRLTRGAIVVGRQKMAGFLKIESSSGERGFVLLQDIEERIIKQSDVTQRGLPLEGERVKPELYNDPFEKQPSSFSADDEDL